MSPATNAAALQRPAPPVCPSCGANHTAPNSIVVLSMRNDTARWTPAHFDCYQYGHARYGYRVLTEHDQSIAANYDGHCMTCGTPLKDTTTDGRFHLPVRPFDKPVDAVSDPAKMPVCAACGADIHRNNGRVTVPATVVIYAFDAFPSDKSPAPRLECYEDETNYDTPPVYTCGCGHVTNFTDWGWS